METYQVRPFTDYLPEYKDKHRIILNYIESRTDLDLVQRLQLLNIQLIRLKELYVSTRRVEYQSKSVELSVGHTCTNGESGVTKKCGWRCVKAPIEGLYVTQNRVVGDNKGVSVTETQACLFMSVSGRGRNSGTLYATFRYKPSFIESIVERENTALLNMVTSRQDFSEYVDERTGDFTAFSEEVETVEGDEEVRLSGFSL